MFLKLFLAVSHHFSGVLNSFFFVSQLVQKDSISVVKMSPLSRLLLKRQYPSRLGV